MNGAARYERTSRKGEISTLAPEFNLLQEVVHSLRESFTLNAFASCRRQALQNVTGSPFGFCLGNWSYNVGFICTE